MHKFLRRLLSVSPTRIVALGFLAIILIGTALLALPFATRAEGSCGFVPALFTATSATCVTGLVVADTWTMWTAFGQVVIILLIQTGGLGFMTVFAVFSFLLHRRIGLKERLVMVQSFNLNDISGVVRLVRHVLFGTLAIEGAGAAVLTVCFARRFGFWGGLARGVFHSISAFCNAGFDLMGSASPGSSLALYAADPAVNIVIILLIVLGGLGFFVWEDLASARSWKRLGVHSRIVLTMTAALLLGGWALYAAFEWTNPATIGGMSTGGKLLASLFQSATTRTAGFATVPQENLTGAGKLTTLILMFIGGSPGSTAGGVKTVTIAVTLVSLHGVLRGKEDVNLFGRRISAAQVRDCTALVSMVALLDVLGTLLLIAFDGAPVSAAAFEVVSALGTVGLSMSLTPTLGTASLLLLTALMYVGRVGIMTIGLATMITSRRSGKLRYTEQRIMIG